MQESLWHMHTGRNLKMLIDGTYVAIASWNFMTSNNGKWRGGAYQAASPIHLTQCINKIVRLASEELQ